MTQLVDAVERGRRLLRDAKRVFILTGAGISAESGVPTFRGVDGLWRSFRPEELATPEAFARDPRLVWEWYAWRRERIEACRPNAAHLALANMALRRGGVDIVTQNVDGLHTAAARAVAEEGDPSAALPLELHGSIFRVRCTRCGQRYEDREPIVTDSLESLPSCRYCEGLLRPDVVWFGEALDPGILDRAFDLAASADVCIVVGTSALVQPAASLPHLTRQGGGRVIEVNLEPTPLTRTVDLSILAPAAEAIPPLVGDSEPAK